MPLARSPLADLFADLGAIFERLGLAWYLFGAQAALLHGAARLTADVDVTLDCGDLSVGDLLHALQAGGFEPRIADAADFAARTRVLPLAHAATAIPVDVILAGPGLEPLFLARAEMRDVEGTLIRVARAEDVVSMKILAGRGKDLEDAAAILAARGDGLDLAMIRRTLADLEAALDQRDLLPRFEDAVVRARRS